MNQPYARVSQPYATLTLASALHKVFGVQLYKNNSDCLQHTRNVRGVYECRLFFQLKYNVEINLN